MTDIRGVRRTPTGWQAYVRVQGKLYTKRYPAHATLTEMKRWREEKRVRLRINAPAPSSTTFSQDVEHYLAHVQSMPTLRWRRDDLHLWIAALGAHRDRKTISASEIRVQLERWKSEGYAASTLNHRRTALMHLWTVLDGKSAANPARDVPRYTEDIRPPNALSQAAVQALLAAMRPSQTKARLSLMAWTGWPQAQIARLKPEDIDWNRTVYIRGRKKGRGVDGVYLPLLPQGWTALREFKRLGCWASFSTSAMRTALRRAAVRVSKNSRIPKRVRTEVADVTPYQFRHSFGTLVAGITKDDRAVQSLMLHADVRQTHRYTGATVDARTLNAVSEVAKRLPREHKSQKH